MSERNIFKDIMGGQMLVRNGGLYRHWAFLLYVCALVLLAISIRFGVKDAMLQEVRNAEKIENLKSEYTGKYAELLLRSKKGEVERALHATGSRLIPPDNMPKRVRLADEHRD